MWTLHPSLRFIPTRHETGLRRNPSIVQNCGEKLNRGRIGKREVAYGFVGILEHERVAAEDSGNEDLELHVRQVLSHTCPVIRADQLCRVYSLSRSSTDLGPYENGLKVFWIPA